MLKTDFIHGIIAGVLASIAGIIYSHVYFFANEADFSSVINMPSIIGFNLAAGMVFTAIHAVLKKWLKKNAELVFSLTISVFFFALIVVPISISLPLNIKTPELFPGLAVPMLFFPAIAWFSIDPIFRQTAK